jgi:S-adenosylmethionine synthetase
MPIGGGAWSGKDFHKVERLGGLLAPSLAKRAVALGLAREAPVALEHTPGCALH